jgi:transcription antitermination factor NusG
MTTTKMTDPSGRDWPGLPPAYVEPRWYAAYTCARHEKRVAEQLERRSVELFLPLYETVQRWKNGRARVQLPLFPGYVFVHIALRDRLQVLEVPSVVRLVGFNGNPTPLADGEVEALREGLVQRMRAAPHPFLTVGKRARVRSGPFAGLEGILLRRKGNCRFVLSIELIRRSIIVDIDAADFEPVAGTACRRGSSACLPAATTTACARRERASSACAVAAGSPVEESARTPGGL